MIFDGQEITNVTIDAFLEPYAKAFIDKKLQLDTRIGFAGDNAYLLVIILLDDKIEHLVATRESGSGWKIMTRNYV